MKHMSFEKAVCFFFAQLPELILFFEINTWKLRVKVLKRSTDDALMS